MAINSPRSVHALVRLLRSTTDPPASPGPFKIEMACLAWSDSSFHAANKGEVIGEWLLTLLGQAKKAGREKYADTLDPIADSRYWILLCAVLTTPAPTAVRPVKTWLLPLLNRFQADAIILELLALRSSQVLAPARQVLAIVWPLAEKKISIDALAECLGAVLNVCTEWDRVNEDLGWICSAVVSAYRHALVNAGNKKKLYTSFLTSQLSSWLGAICSRPSTDGTAQLQDSIYAAGTDTLFSLDALKQPLDSLFDALGASIPSLLPVLPKLYTSFLSATHRHRSALFASTTSVIGGKEQVRKRGVEFLGGCWTLFQDSSRCREDLEVEKWKSAIGVLKIVEKERFFVRGVLTDATKDEHGGKRALSEMRDNAVERLEAVGTSSKDHRADQAILSIQLLGILVQIEYDLVGPVLERVLTALINVPPQLIPLITTTSSELLDHVLEYHTKTRTVHTYALTLLSASAASHTPRPTTSALPLAYHLPAFARALRTSVTPTQTIPLSVAVLQAVDRAWRTFKNTDEDELRSTKKRKLTEEVTGHETTSMADLARVFSCMGRVAGTILSNLPASAYTTEEEYSLDDFWVDVGKLGWNIVWACLGKNPGQEDGGIKGKHGKKRKHAGEMDTLTLRSRQIVASTALRFLYDARARLSSLLGNYDRLGEADIGTLLDVARDEASNPGLVLEIIRTLLWHAWYTHRCKSLKEMGTHPMFTMIFDLLTSHSLSQSKWYGVSADLTRGDLGLAILYVLTERWIDVIDALASTEILDRLISLLLDASLDLSDGGTRSDPDGADIQSNTVVITLRGILLRLLRNAQFWELHNMRAVLLSSVLALTAPLSPYCYPTGTDSPSPPKAAIAHHELARACNAYDLLLYVPIEYFTRSVRAELVRRAMAGDIQICMALEAARSHKTTAKRKHRDKGDVGDRSKSCTEVVDERDPACGEKRWLRRLTAVRVFLLRTGQFLGISGHSTCSSFVNHLLNPPSSSSPPSNVLTSITLDLVQSYVTSLLQSRESEAAASFSDVISTLVNARPYSQPKSQETWTQTIVQSSILKLIGHATNDIDPSSLHDLVKNSFKTLFEVLESALLPLATRWVEVDPRELDQLLSSDQLDAWSRILSLRRWLGVDSQTAMVPIGLKLAASMICTEARLDSKTCSSALGLLFEELQCTPAAVHRTHLDVLVAFYAVCGAERVMDMHVIHALKKMSVEDFSHLLDVLEDGIRGSGLRVDLRGHLIHLGQVMLHDAPQGTLKVIQRFATRCFDLFANRKDLYEGSSQLKLQCLEFIARHCSDRPAAIRSVDLGSIWSLLSKTLSGSSEHAATTSFLIFHHVVTIVGALIRLRRDLVVHTLPHLSLVLRLLMMLTRNIRPQLGAKQTKIVTDTFPSWLSAASPLTTDDARALARLLTALTTKTVPRTYGTSAATSAEPQKAVSLAKPFAKHASYVLIAYVDAFNDPLCILNAEMRQALEPGLFALCEMVGEHTRDALMVSALDAGGKVILKSLWKEYEKQRYVGKG